ncbi:MAG TPA: phosphoglucosamine mutase [Candidatus Aminicenantes bacterium]|nr:phosphoglucosamine mutase [Candidatus Aminicenantes bacterium]
MQKLFGTDGIRAAAGEYPLDEPSVRTLGRALVDLLQAEGLPPRILIGRDTRESGDWIEEALIRGISSAGGQCASAGIIPTSAVSHLARTFAFSAGIVVSASHNPYKDNGIKIFSSAGLKISDAWEDRLETEIARRPEVRGLEKADVRPDPVYRREYEHFLRRRFAPGPGPKGMKIVLDCANGSASAIAPEVFGGLGFTIVATEAEPDGRNINEECGALHPEKLAQTVLARKADLGIAFDGDADRALWVDHRGRILSGDHTLFVLSRAMKARGLLRGRSVVATTMSNMGLEKALAADGLSLVRTRVGDKYVLEKMLSIRANLGGERSGHTILSDECPTGDGLLTALKLLEVMVEKNLPLADLTRDYAEYPQVLKNVRVARKPAMDGLPELVAAIADVRERLGKNGRLEVRYSGTEPLARVMVEGGDEDLIEILAARITAAIRKTIGV